MKPARPNTPLAAASCTVRDCRQQVVRRLFLGFSSRSCRGMSYISMRIHNYLQIFRSMKLAAPDRIHVFEAAGPERLDHILSFVWLAWADHPPVGSLPLVASLPTAHDGEKKNEERKKEGISKRKNDRASCSTRGRVSRARVEHDCLHACLSPLSPVLPSRSPPPGPGYPCDGCPSLASIGLNSVVKFPYST